MSGFSSGRNSVARKTLIQALILGMAVMVPAVASSQTWVWTTETVDASGTATSLAADHSGNIHLSYADEEGTLKYAFRPEGAARWLNMRIDSEATHTNLRLDREGNPHICATFRKLKYSHFDGQKWHTHEIVTDQAQIGFSCSVGIGPDGTPHLAWYKDRSGDGSLYLHLKYGVLQDDVWLIRTVDFDAQTGKWSSMILDPQGNSYVCYDAWVKGDLRYAHWDGKKWNIQIVDSRGGGRYNIGMGNSIFMDGHGKLHFSYYADNSVMYAQKQNETWIRQTVDTVTPTGGWTGWRTTVVVDSVGTPHVAYEDGGAIRHAYRDGQKWRVQIIAASNTPKSSYSSMTIDKQDTLYISYRDPADGSLKVAIGRRAEQAQTAGAEKK